MKERWLSISLFLSLNLHLSLSLSHSPLSTSISILFFVSLLMPSIFKALIFLYPNFLFFHLYFISPTFIYLSLSLTLPFSCLLSFPLHRSLTSVFFLFVIFPSFSFSLFYPLPVCKMWVKTRVSLKFLSFISAIKERGVFLFLFGFLVSPMKKEEKQIISFVCVTFFRLIAKSSVIRGTFTTFLFSLKYLGYNLGAV